MPPFYENKDTQQEELNEIVTMECVCGHCQNSFNSNCNNNNNNSDIEDDGEGSKQKIDINNSNKMN